MWYFRHTIPFYRYCGLEKGKFIILLLNTLLTGNHPIIIIIIITQWDEMWTYRNCRVTKYDVI